jgi:ATP phosphoribosyltransferase
LIEFIVAHLRAVDNVSIFANIRGDSPEAIAELVFEKSVIGGLQGPTISPILNLDRSNWYAVHLIVRKDQLSKAIEEIREVGGSGVVVSPVMYIFEEEPAAFKELLSSLEF